MSEVLAHDRQQPSRAVHTAWAPRRPAWRDRMSADGSQCSCPCARPASSWGVIGAGAPRRHTHALAMRIAAFRSGICLLWASVALALVQAGPASMMQLRHMAQHSWPGSRWPPPSSMLRFRPSGAWPAPSPASIESPDLTLRATPACRRARERRRRVLAAFSQRPQRPRLRCRRRAGLRAARQTARPRRRRQRATPWRRHAPRQAAESRRGARRRCAFSVDLP